jgi:hypothetical protein
MKNKKIEFEIDNSRKISAIRLIKNFAIDNQMYDCTAEFLKIERDIIIENNRNIKIGSLFFNSDKSVPMIDDTDQCLYVISLIEKFINKDKIKIMEFLDKMQTMPAELRESELDLFLRKWQGSNMQTDDMLFIGICPAEVNEKYLTYTIDRSTDS